MIAAEKLEDMAINPSEIKTEEDVKELFGDYTTYEDLKVGLALIKDLDLLRVSKYIVTLYSDDSILNTRPPMPLDERQIRAIQMSGLRIYDGKPAKSTKRFLIDLDNRQIFEFVFEFLTKQKKFVWQEIVTLETQILENQRLRMQPVDENSGKDNLMAFEKKGKMTLMYKDWYLALKEAYDDFYGDNENVRAIHRINRANMATLENIAF